MNKKRQMQSGIFFLAIIVFALFFLSGCNRPPTCGNGICEIDKNETVFNCRADCGKVSCTSDLNCPAPVFGNRYCDLNSTDNRFNVVRDINRSTCLYPGEIYSRCNQSIIKEVIQRCSANCVAGACVESPIIICTSDLNCPPTVYGALRCDLNITNNKYSVVRDINRSICINPGTVNSRCNTINDRNVIQVCTQTCVNGVCVSGSVPPSNSPSNNSSNSPSGSPSNSPSGSP